MIIYGQTEAASMKKSLCVLLILIMAVGFCACSGNGQDQISTVPPVTERPIASPSEVPVSEPEEEPVEEPSEVPSEEPSAAPSEEPEAETAEEPALEPSEEPAGEPEQEGAEAAAKGPAGFLQKDPESFAARAEGVYILDSAVNGSEDGWAPVGVLEIYSVGDNLYGFYSEWGFAALEFFPAEEDFSSVEADSLPVMIQTFSVQSNAGEYWYRGVPASMCMTLTGEGVTFTGLAAEGGNSALPDDCSFLRLDEEPGNVESFDYRSFAEPLREMLESDSADGLTGVMPGGIPETAAGLWQFTDESGESCFIEFTPEGLVQVYRKYLNEQVSLFRGACVAEEKDAGRISFHLLTMRLGNGSSPAYWGFCAELQQDGSMLVTDADTFDNGEFPQMGTVLYPAAPTDIPTLTGEFLPVPGSLQFFIGTFRDVWGYELSISPIGAFYYYGPGDEQNMDAMTIGYASETDTGLRLTAVDQETGEETPFGAVSYASPVSLYLEAPENSMPLPFVFTDGGMYTPEWKTELPGNWYLMSGETYDYSFDFSEDGTMSISGPDPETGEWRTRQGCWDLGEGGGDYRCYILMDEDRVFQHVATIYYSTADDVWILGLDNGANYC